MCSKGKKIYKIAVAWFITAVKNILLRLAVSAIEICLISIRFHTFVAEIFNMKIKNSYILLLILFTGSLLRLLFINEIPFTHDEFSALSRLHFNSFSELVANGIIIDGHPAGVQVFLYYWVKIFGWTEIAVKMPFIIMGILSLWLIYKIGKFWYNETIGLVTAAFMATMQFTIMYSQIARPYGSGLFICLAMVYYWSQLVFNAEKKYWLHFALYVLFSALAAYNHHFSLLFAAIVGFTGLFFVRERQLLYYVLSGIAIFVLYIPHLNIFFYQLSVGTGGIEGWLDKPHSDFLFNFLGYLFHYSYLIYAVVIGLIVMGINQSEWSKKHTKLLLVFLAWFILPMVIGYVYSKYIAAVLQASMLIFSFPYLFFILFGHLKNQTPGMNATLVLVIMVLNISVLVLNRQHFYFVTHSPYEQILKEHDLAQKKYAGNVTSLIDSHHEISDYYIKRDNIPTNFSWSDSIGSIYDLGLFLKEQQSKNEYLYFGALTESNPVLVNIIMGYFPELVWQKNYSGGTAYLFSRAQKVPKDSIFLSVQDFEKK